MAIMKLTKIITAVLAVMLAVPAMGQNKGKSLEVSFNYEKQGGPGSNQYAVWIENDKGNVVKTLFVTSFTAKGRARGNAPAQRGYVMRPACVPTWVKVAKASEQTDQQGKAVPQGTYKVFVEATLYNNSDIIYSGTFSTKDKAGNVTLTSKLTEPDEQHKNMVTNVKAVLK